MTALAGKLADRIAFSDPLFKPDLFVELLGGCIVPAKGSPALMTIPSLFIIFVKSILFNISTETIGALFF